MPPRKDLQLRPYMTKSPVLMLDRIKCWPFELLNCETSDLDKYCCKNCDFQTDLKIIYYQHIRECHGNNIDYLQDQSKKDIVLKSYICQKCSFETYSVLLWLKHLDSLCFNAKEDFEKVQTVSCDEKWYQCVYCSFETKQPTVLKKHKSAEHIPDEGEWFCSHCKYQAKPKNHLKQHINCEHDRCDFKTRRKLKIKQNALLKHPSDKEVLWHQCEQCSYKTKWKHCLKLHLNRHKSAEEVKWFYCFSCDYKTETRGCLKQHTIYKHTSSEAVQWFKL
jgi:KRAB domain-containing zinc finger protein